MSGFLNTIGIIAIICLVVLGIAVFSSFKYSKDDDGKVTLSFFWGAIKVNEKEQKVNILGDFIAVDGKDEKVKVAGIVDVDGKDELVNIDNGKILVDGKESVIKVEKSLVVEVKEDHVIIQNNFNSDILKVITSLKKKDDKNLKVEGRVVGEDDRYLILEPKDASKININVKFES
ncbi:MULTISPECIES: hypothetical protein [unclassified Halobacteriovorax]|uniref:hypothetical protein n=1 Tax=unclassified Halobacteriovorax TaxID=2639665 RepID=UPI003999BFC6